MYFSFKVLMDSKKAYLNNFTQMPGKYIIYEKNFRVRKDI